MRDFLLDDQDRAFRAAVRDVLQRELLPRTQTIEDNDDWSAIKAVVRALGEAGFLKLMFADLYRGPLQKPGLTHATILSEEAAHINYAFETTIATALSCAYPLHRHAAAEIRQRYLPGIVDGKIVGAICVTEPEAGSDTSRMQTKIEHDAARREYVINGRKRYISNAGVADVYIVYGVTDPAAAPGKGISAVVVPSAARGLSFPRRNTFIG
ncbi:MAG: acyl-CoA dehydrogenase family protein, partial [Burkholderiaceae bacterium]